MSEREVMETSKQETVRPGGATVTLRRAWICGNANTGVLGQHEAVTDSDCC